jgi:hypothetical protein
LWGIFDKIKICLILKAGGFASGIFYYEKSEDDKWVLKHLVITREQIG